MQERVSPQLENGYAPIANESIEGILKYKFSKRELRVLFVLFRFSYGFSKKAAVFDMLQDFAIYGIPTCAIGNTLANLEARSVINVDWECGEIEYQKDYTRWRIDKLETFNEEVHKKLIDLNLKHKKKGKVQVSGWEKRNKGGGRPRKKT